jgi:hypothetical protein
MLSVAVPVVTGHVGIRRESRRGIFPMIQPFLIDCITRIFAA